MLSLPLICAGILAFVVFVYVILDGFDLGIGILYPFIHDKASRDIMMNSVAPVWDGNETWLVLGAAMLYGAFPIAYSTLLPTLYIPILIMLAALIFRGVAFEFRFKAHKSQLIWDVAFSIGSTLATFAQGIILGTFVQGYGAPLINTNPYEWLTPFSLLSGVALICGYALLGATWLISKTTDTLQDKMYFAAKILLPFILIFIGAVSIWTPLISETVWTRWFSIPNIFYLAPLPIATLIAGITSWRILKKPYERLPFYLTISVFLFCYIGFCISAWPYIIPHSVTIWDAASNPGAMKFILIGISILLPTLIGYTFYSYYIFRGKTVAESGYH